MNAIDELYQLCLKYNPKYPRDDLLRLVVNKTNSVFLSVVGEPPLNKKSKKDSDKMQKLYNNIEVLK